MAIQLKRGDGTANAAYTGLAGEITVDYTNEVLRVHDGTASGGVFQVGLGGDASPTNLSANYAAGTVTITSSTGSDAIINSATPTDAGVMSSSDKQKLDGIAEGAEVNEIGSSDIAVFETSTELNARDNANRDRNNHTGTQTSSTISNFNTSVTTVIEGGNWDVDFGTL